MKQSEYPVVILGSGVAGLYSALRISKKLPENKKILLVTKCPLGESNSRYAQGGIAAVIKQNKSDSVELHSNDTVKAGSGLSDEHVAKFISDISDEVINDLILNGVEFDKNENGDLEYALAGAHSVKRVLHAGGDITGRYMIEALSNDVKHAGNIDVLEKTMAVKLLINSKQECCGVIIYNKITNEHEVIYTPNLIIATGGTGQIYKYTTNPYGATGDGIALAYDAGAIIQDIEFIQFHPTALAISPESKNRFLISEAVRGEGAKLINSFGEEFMSRYSEKRELAPRDIVTRAIFSEMIKENKPNVFLDTSKIDSKTLLKRFPTIAKKCKTNGIDITCQPIPVAPAAHYTIGGIKSDINGKTSIKGLYAIGEAASTAFHGANRLACNSLLECVVAAYEISNSINDFEKPCVIDKNIQNTIEKFALSDNKNISDCNYLKNKLRDIMWNNVGIIRTKESLIRAKNEIEIIQQYIDSNSKYSCIAEYELKNMLTVAFLVTNEALKREESRGAHYRIDYTQTEPNPHHSCTLLQTVC